MFDHSEQVAELAAALCKAQSTMKPATKNAKNPFYKSNYATLDAVWESVRKPLSDNGLSVSQIPTAGGLVTVLMHTSGQWVAGCLPYNAKDLTPQGIGSAITYARRYALGAITGQATEDDDDGEAAMNRDKKTSKKQEPKSIPSQYSIKCQSELDALDKIDDGLDLAEWGARMNRNQSTFTKDELDMLRGAYSMKKDLMDDGHTD